MSVSLFAGMANATRNQPGSFGSVVTTGNQLNGILRILVAEKVREPFFVTSQPDDSFLIIFKERVFLPRATKLKALLEEKGGKVKVSP